MMVSAFELVYEYMKILEIKALIPQPRSQGFLLPALGENPGNEVVNIRLLE